jgi:Tol biopolymer transport system component
VGSSKLPAGKYIIHMLDDSDLMVMEISSADGSTSALFNVQSAKANSASARSELIFNKYGNRYFLAELFDEDNPDGSRVVESRYEKRIDKATLEAQEHVTAYHRKG